MRALYIQSNNYEFSNTNFKQSSIREELRDYDRLETLTLSEHIIKATNPTLRLKR